MSDQDASMGNNAENEGPQGFGQRRKRTNGADEEQGPSHENGAPPPIQGYTPKQRMDHKFNSEKPSNIEIVAFSVCCLAEKILINEMNDNNMPNKMEWGGKPQLAENLYGAVMAALQIVNTKGRTKNSKEEPIKVTMNYVDDDYEVNDTIVHLDYYGVWTSILKNLGLDIKEETVLRVVNELVAGEALYRDLENITHSQQSGAAKAQLGNPQMYPHFLCSGKKSSTMTAVCEMGGFMAVLNEIIRISKIQKVMDGKTGPNGETLGMRNFMAQMLKNRLPPGHGFVVDTIIAYASKTDQSVVQALKSNLGQYLARVPPKRALPDLPQMFICMSAFCLDLMQIAPTKINGELMERSHRIFNLAIDCFESSRVQFVTYAIGQGEQVTVEACGKVQTMLVHYCGVTFGNCGIVDEYLGKTVGSMYTEGCLSWENYTGGLGKMGKFAFFKKHKDDLKMNPVKVDLVPNGSINRICVNFVRDVKTATVARNLAPSLPTDLSGDADATYVLAQPVYAIDSAVSPAEYAKKVDNICEMNRAIRTTKGKVKARYEARGIVMNYQPRKGVALTAEQKEGYSKLVKIDLTRALKLKPEEQDLIAVAMSLMFDAMLEDGTYQDGSFKSIEMLGAGATPLVVPDEIKDRMAKLERDIKRQKTKANKKTYDGMGDVDF